MTGRTGGGWNVVLAQAPGHNAGMALVDLGLSAAAYRLGFEARVWRIGASTGQARARLPELGRRMDVGIESLGGSVYRRSPSPPDVWQRAIGEQPRPVARQAGTRRISVRGPRLRGRVEELVDDERLHNRIDHILEVIRAGAVITFVRDQIDQEVESSLSGFGATFKSAKA